MGDEKKNGKIIGEEIEDKKKKRKNRLDKNNTSDIKTNNFGADIKDNDDTQTIGELFEGDADKEPYR